VIDWEWTKKTVAPDDILDGARTIKGPIGSHGVRLTYHWISAERLLEWAKAALARGGNDGWDTAAGLAKRAVCRQMDSILVHSHLGHLLGQNYGKKAVYLASLNVLGLATLRELGIDPRNDIEHAYSLATEDQARRACDIAELFLGASARQAEAPAFLDLGWNFEWAGSPIAGAEDEQRSAKVKLEKDHPPFLFMNGYPDAPEAVILMPREKAADFCPLKEFKSEQALQLNEMITTRPDPENYSICTSGIGFFRSIARELKL
jgi:hypothetical protein